MGRHKAKKPRRIQSTPPVETQAEKPPQILFDASDPRIEVFRRVKVLLNADIEPDPADLQLLWEWHQEDPMTA